MSTTPSSQEQPPVDWATVTQDFKTALAGKLEEPKLQAAVEAIHAASTTTGYAANGSVASLIFYLQFQVNVNNGKSFNGKAGGISNPGGGALFGTVYTSDINALYNNTVSFQFICTPVYTSLIFFDGNSNALGTYQAGGVGIVSGVGGGSGGWS